MARESCNLDKDEAELIKASSPQQSSSLGSLFSISCEGSESTASPERANNSATVIATEKLKSKVVVKLDKHVRFINRCCLCKKKVGLTGFRCRCGDLFCGEHRYSDAHECSFDYKAYGREEIAKANPVIRAAKIIKI